MSRPLAAALLLAATTLTARAEPAPAPTSESTTSSVAAHPERSDGEAGAKSRGTPAPDANPMERFGWLRHLVGACWHGLHADGVTSDTQCYEAQWKRHLRGTITISWLKDGKRAEDFNGDSVFSWSDQRGRILFTNWSSTGGYGLGEAYLEGDSVIFPSMAKVATSEQRHRWIRLGRDEFAVIRERKVGEAWTEVTKVTYRRVGKKDRKAGKK